MPQVVVSRGSSQPLQIKMVPSFLGMIYKIKVTAILSWSIFIDGIILVVEIAQGGSVAVTNRFNLLINY